MSECHTCTRADCVVVSSVFFEPLREILADVTLHLAAHSLTIDRYYQLAIFPASSLSPGTSSTASPHTAASRSNNRIDRIQREQENMSKLDCCSALTRKLL